MICHRRKFIFVHIGKNGGQSVEKALRPFAFSRLQRAVRYIDIRTGKRDPFGIMQAGSHPSVDEVKSAVGEDVFDAYYTFSFVRNPWSRLLSYYSFAKLRPNSRHHNDAMTLDFNDFVGQLDGEPPMRSQSNLIGDAQGTPQVDFVGRFETLDQDFQTVCAKLGCHATLPHKNRTETKDYRVAYTTKSIDAVASIFADDVKHFGYRFE